jgi:hypothetical protein
MISIPNQSINILKAFKTLGQLKKLQSAFDLLYDIKPKMLIKGCLSSEFDDVSCDYCEIERITSRYIYLVGDTVPYSLYDEHYLIKMQK